MLPIGLLALQGDFHKHAEAFSRAGFPTVFFRDVSQLPDLSAVVIPGGESTTIGMLMERRGLVSALKAAIEGGLPVFGTCAGAILLASDIEDSDQTRLGTMDISIQRNAYGSQVDSFEAMINVSGKRSGLSGDLEGVFIRAPLITKVGSAVEVIAEFNGSPVLVRQGKMLAATFHPELTSSDKVQIYFVHELIGA